MSYSAQKITLILLIVFITFIIAALFFILAPKLPQISFSPGKSGPGSCKILEEKYCKNAKIIEYKTPAGSTAFFAAFKVPVGTPIFSPIDASDSEPTTNILNDKKGAEKKYIGVALIEYYIDKNKIAQPIQYNFIYKDTKEYLNLGSKPKKGEIIGKVANSKIDALGDYNLIFEFTITAKESENAPPQFISTEQNLRDFLNLKN